jgi:hypothetical protein
MTENSQHGTDPIGITGALWASAGWIVGAFYLGYYCAKFFLLR